VISSWSALLAYVKTALAHETREQFRVLFLDLSQSTNKTAA
jgi:DNA repair protein RadC